MDGERTPRNKTPTMRSEVATHRATQKSIQEDRRRRDVYKIGTFFKKLIHTYIVLYD